ncbi:Venom peptide HsVx1 [Frankliniella fusca]|uniref:Venom peptide HsVx1 n=1 Tax=Frankliniella fusca TaxID=407009 RepID=A0AAE1HGV7_9NEOP|nr:Venom peptide HsVx1 [Frankliniella fusca]
MLVVVGALLAVGLAVNCASAAQIPAGSEKPQEPQEQPRGCTFRGQLYAAGERWATGPPNKCAKYICEGDDQIAALTCPWFVPAPGCRAIPGDENAVYPGCCPMRKCREPVPLQGHGQGLAAEASTAAPDAAPAARAAPVIRVTISDTTTDATTDTTTTTTTTNVGEDEDSSETVFTSTMTPPPI